MITDRRTLLLGIFIVLIPFIGFPSAWKTFMIVASGVLLISFSIQIILPKKIPRRTVRRKETVNPVFHESIITEPSPSVKKEKTPDTNPTLQKETSNESFLGQ